MGAHVGLWGPHGAPWGAVGAVWGMQLLVSRVFARIFVIISIFAFSADFYDFLENKLATPSLGESGERANPWSTPALAHSSRLSPSAPRARSISRECRDTGLGGAARREKNNNTQQ